MLELIFASVRDSLLTIIIPFLITSINADIHQAGIYDSSKVCSVRFHDAVMFARTEDWETFTVVEKSDSIYLTNKFQDYFDEFNKKFVKNILNARFTHIFLNFHYGRVQSLDNVYRMDVVLHAERNPMKFAVFVKDEVIGTAQVTPYFNPTMTENAYTVLANLGVDRFNTIFIFLHETSHFMDWLDGKRISNEYETDLNALKLLDKYYDKIKYIVEK